LVRQENRQAALGNGGSADDISAGADFVKQLKEAGNFLPAAIIESGQPPVVINREYLNWLRA